MSWFCFRKSPAGPCLTCRNEKNCGPNTGMEVRMLEPAQKRMLESKGLMLPPLPVRGEATIAPLAGASSATGPAPTPAKPAATKPKAVSTKRRRAPVDNDTDEEEEYRPTPKRRSRATQRVTSPLTSVPPSDMEMSAGPSRSSATPAADHGWQSQSRSPTRLDTPVSGAATDGDVERFISNDGEGEDELDPDQGMDEDEMKDDTRTGNWDDARRPPSPRCDPSIPPYPSMEAIAHPSAGGPQHHRHPYPYAQQPPEQGAWENMTRETDPRGPFDTHSPREAQYAHNVAHHPDAPRFQPFDLRQPIQQYYAPQHAENDYRQSARPYPNDQRRAPSSVAETRRTGRLFTAPNLINRGGTNGEDYGETWPNGFQHGARRQ